MALYSLKNSPKCLVLSIGHISFLLMIHLYQINTFIFMFYLGCDMIFFKLMISILLLPLWLLFYFSFLVFLWNLLWPIFSLSDFLGITTTCTSSSLFLLCTTFSHDFFTQSNISYVILVAHKRTQNHIVNLLVPFNISFSLV